MGVCNVQTLSTFAVALASQVLRVLLKLLETGRDGKTLAVGCHDLGCFITHYPAGKGIVTGVPSASVEQPPSTSAPRHTVQLVTVSQKTLKCLTA